MYEGLRGLISRHIIYNSFRITATDLKGKSNNIRGEKQEPDLPPYSSVLWCSRPCSVRSEVTPLAAMNQPAPALALALQQRSSGSRRGDKG